MRKLRLTGGEPLVRKNIMFLVRELGHQVEPAGLDELTLTTNGSQLARHADELYDCGVRRINVSLDTLDPDKFRTITRWGDLAQGAWKASTRPRPAGIEDQAQCRGAEGLQRRARSPTCCAGRMAAAWTSP